MSRFNHRRKLTPKEIFLRTIVLLATILILASVMPRNTVNEISYKQGESWEDSL